jgi:2-methylisocitrate lyase-like PEP mutase family enzyme
MVMAESEGWADDAALAAHLGFSPEAVRAALIAATAGVLDGAVVPGKRAETLVKLTAFTQNVALPVGARP